MDPNLRHATSAYRQAATMVPPMTAVVLLYDKAILLLQRAGQMARDGQTEGSYGCVTKATAILRGLSHVLDFERGGAVAEILRATYTRNIFALHASFGKPDMQQRYAKIVEGLVELRDAWAGIAGTTRREGEKSSRPGRA